MGQMSEQSLKSKVLNGAVWSLVTKLSMKLFSFIVTLVLARLLTPSDYGIISLLTIFISIASTFAESGFGRALVQKKDIKSVDYNTVFYTSLVVSGLVYSLLFVTAPYIARFYDNESLIPIMRVLSVSVVFNAINGVQSAELQRSLRFKESFKITTISAVWSAIVGISLAFAGYGPWAIVWSQVASGIATTIGYWTFIAWRPAIEFSFASLKASWGYGWKLTLSGLLDTASRNLASLIIGKLYTKEDLAFVDKGKSVPYLAMDIVNSAFSSVMFPSLAKLQGDRLRFLNAMRKMIQYSTFVVFPVMFGVASCAEPIVLLMFGGQWLPIVPYVQIACIEFAYWPLTCINLSAVNALGRSDLYLRMEIFKKVVTLTLLAATIRFGVFWFVLISAVVSVPISFVVNAWPCHRIIGYRIGMQLADIMPTTVCCLIMSGVVFGVNMLMGVSSPFVLFALVPIGGLVYWAACRLVGVRAMAEIFDLMACRLPSRFQKYRRIFC